jgi:hypothetical protein
VFVVVWSFPIDRSSRFMSFPNPFHLLVFASCLPEPASTSAAPPTAMGLDICDHIVEQIEMDDNIECLESIKSAGMLQQLLQKSFM